MMYGATHAVVVDLRSAQAIRKPVMDEPAMQGRVGGPDHVRGAGDAAAWMVALSSVRNGSERRAPFRGRGQRRRGTPVSAPEDAPVGGSSRRRE